MAKLWDKGYELDEDMERFTVGQDYLSDQALAEADVLGTTAHARMLAEIGILTQEELRRLGGALREILALCQRGEFVIRRSDEDVHTAVENTLVARLGDLGKKVHTARSRNDQVILDLRLYMRTRLLAVQELTLNAAQTLACFADEHKAVPMPGRTHTQLAMPSSVGLWAAAFAESLVDDLSLLVAAYHLVNQCPLGSAASYGVPLPIDRQLTSDLLGFDRVQNNVLYVNNSRGKMEGIAVFALSQVTEDLAKLANDLILFSIPELGYFSLPEEYCPGSSIMPQKRNPCPLELIRSRSVEVVTRMLQILMTTHILPSGYNRDLQDTKGPTMTAFDTAESCLKVIRKVFERLTVNEEALLKAFRPEIFAADEALELVRKGMPFRDAYREVAQHLDALEAKDPRENIRSKTHLGAPGNLGLEALQAEIAEGLARVEKERGRLAKVRESLVSEP